MKKRILYPAAGFLLVFVLHAAFSMWRAAKISSQWVGLEDASPFRLYLGSRNYFMSLSYGLAAGFTLYALSRFLANRKRGVKGVIGGMTLTGVLYFAACFLSGCCGSPMLPVYLSLFGASFLGFAKPLALLLTLISVSIGFVWMERKKKMADGKGCCQAEEEGIEISVMPSQAVADQIRSELQQGMGLAKCRRCGCMEGALEDLRDALSALQTPENQLLDEVRSWLGQMEPIRYPCLGCQHCFPAEALNSLHQTPWAAAELVASASGSAPDLQERAWPPVPGNTSSLVMAWIAQLLSPPWHRSSWLRSSPA